MPCGVINMGASVAARLRRTGRGARRIGVLHGIIPRCRRLLGRPEDGQPTGTHEMTFVINPVAAAAVPVQGGAPGSEFPVHRIYCVGRNYVEHAIEMGHSGREAPFFFMKPSDAVLPGAEGSVAAMRYPSLTSSLHHEVELVVAVGKGGRNISAAAAMDHVWGYAVGLDMTRRDLQNDMKKQGRPWCIGKGFDEAAPIGAIVPVQQAR